MTYKREILTVMGFTILGIIGCFALNYLILENLFIPDPCYYDTHDTKSVY